MKKFMAFVFGLFMAFSFAIGKLWAVGPTGNNKRIVDDLAEKVRTHSLTKDQQRYMMFTSVIDGQFGLYSKTFDEVRKDYTGLLEESFKGREPIPFNCRVFTMYAFSRFKEYTPCKFLRIVTEKRPPHSVVLINQPEMLGSKGRSNWYVCDFCTAMDGHRPEFLFMPITDYMNFMHGLWKLNAMCVIDENGRSYHQTQDLRDLRAWLLNVAHDEQAAMDIVNWEAKNKTSLELMTLGEEYMWDFMDMVGLKA